MASYHELESFAQFGSDLDEATRSKLDRGARTVEVLKQKLHDPIPVEKQVLILYCLTHGYLDKLPVDDVLRFQTELFHNFDDSHADLLQQIKTTGKLPDEDALKAAVSSFMELFKPSTPASAKQ